MADPNYRYTPWTPERRKAASEAAKARWAERRAREEAEYQRERQSARERLQLVRYGKASEMEEIAARWRHLEAEVEEIDTGLKLIEQLRPILIKYRVQQ